ncbi:hypothetical protein F511_07326 [Dorcoceras hygrometricum]|uniref:Uncharacterized protein n=1 Tax=Dorcoceras hygrometricum TaxID=472368 RepID=A0A2Z7CTR8_9LAMI|nr:hypothetical protein F511_07326 [Dorcoceras hygrometricum]
MEALLSSADSKTTKRFSTSRGYQRRPISPKLPPSTETPFRRCYHRKIYATEATTMAQISNGAPSPVATPVASVRHHRNVEALPPRPNRSNHLPPLEQPPSPIVSPASLVATTPSPTATNVHIPCKSTTPRRPPGGTQEVTILWLRETNHYRDPLKLNRRILPLQETPSPGNTEAMEALLSSADSKTTKRFSTSRGYQRRPISPKLPPSTETPFRRCYHRKIYATEATTMAQISDGAPSPVATPVASVRHHRNVEALPPRPNRSNHLPPLEQPPSSIVSPASLVATTPSPTATNVHIPCKSTTTPPTTGRHTGSHRFMATGNQPLQRPN